VTERIGQPELLKEINRSRVFDALRAAHLISRAKLAQQTGLSRATISTLADEFLQIGVAEDVGFGDSTGGRPPVMLKFNPNTALALGARMRDHEWGIVITNLNAQILHQINVPITDGTPETAVKALKQGVATLKSQVGRQKILPAIGLGTPGLVDMHAGVIKTAVDVSWFDVPFREMVEASLGMKAFVTNRSKVGALAELWHGANQGIKELIYVSIGTGVAAGIIHEGKLFMGANSSAGELGHVTILPDGPLCPCGNKGCLQQLVSGVAIANRAREKLRQSDDTILHALIGTHPERITADVVFQAAEQGDSLAKEIIDETAMYLGIALANVVNLFNPELIVLGGPVGQKGEILLEPLQAEVRRRAMAYPLSATRIITTVLGPNAGTVGAATLVLQRASDLLFERT